MYLTFKKRNETIGIRLYYCASDMDAKSFEKYVKRHGWFSIGFNYLVHPNGSIDVGIEHDRVADPSIEGWEDSVCVLVMGQENGKTNIMQQQALKALSDKLNLPLMLEVTSTWNLKS